jgi:nucleoside-diphosphate-sugar epimerase
MSAPGTALVIGATGGIGGSVAEALLDRGWQVRALTRDPQRAAALLADRPGIEWVAGDAMDKPAVIAAARGVGLILHGANPPRYRNWRGLAIPMLDHSIAAAQASGALLVLPGTLYNFGPDAGPVVDERAPQHPLTRKGAVRVEMEQALERAAETGLRSLVVRAGDYFGPSAPSSWFQMALVKPGRPIRAVTYPGSREIGHSWAYLPDLAETILRLAEVEHRLAPFEIVHFGGHWLERGIEIAESVRHVAGRPLPIRNFPWPLLTLGAPFVPLFREILEMRHLWREPLRLDNRKLIGLIGAEPQTPLDAAVRISLAGLGCLRREEETASWLAT